MKIAFTVELVILINILGKDNGVEDMLEIKNIDQSLELPIGTRFYFRNCLYEVVEIEDRKWGCSQCGLSKEEEICEVFNCNYCRCDNKNIFFKEIKETEDENNE